jgi:hypothetical protein
VIPPRYLIGQQAKRSPKRTALRRLLWWLYFIYLLLARLCTSMLATTMKLRARTVRGNYQRSAQLGSRLNAIIRWNDIIDITNTKRNL